MPLTALIPRTPIARRKKNAIKKGPDFEVTPVTIIEMAAIRHSKANINAIL